MRVKDMPRRIRGASVIKASWLGWLKYAGGCACVLITHNGTGRDDADFTVLVMRADDLDKPWRAIAVSSHLSLKTAERIFVAHEETAAWRKEGGGEQR